MDKTLKIYVFYCSNSIEQSRLESCLDRLKGITVKAISLPCSGKVDVPYLVKAFETGADGVVIVTCKQNECRHLEGNRRAHKRAEAVELLLKEIGMDTSRIAVISLKENGEEHVFNEIKEFFERVKNLSELCPVSLLTDRRV